MKRLIIILLAVICGSLSLEAAKPGSETGVTIDTIRYAVPTGDNCQSVAWRFFPVGTQLPLALQVGRVSFYTGDHSQQNSILHYSEAFSSGKVSAIKVDLSRKLAHRSYVYLPSGAAGGTMDGLPRHRRG